MTREDFQREKIRMYKVSIEKTLDSEDVLGRYCYRPDKTEFGVQQLRENKERCDKNEDEAKAIYEEYKCEEITGVSADWFRHEVVGKYGERKMEEEKNRQNNNTHHL